MQRVGVGLRIDRHGLDAEPLAGPHDSAGDLAAIGDQDLVERRLWQPCLRFLLSAVRTGPWTGPYGGNQRQPRCQHQATMDSGCWWGVRGNQHQQREQRHDQVQPHWPGTSSALFGERVTVAIIFSSCHSVAHSCPVRKEATGGRTMKITPYSGMLPCLRQGSRASCSRAS